MNASSLFVLLIGSSLLLIIPTIVIPFVPRSSAAIRFSIWQISVTSLLLIPVGVLCLPEVPLGLGTGVSTRPLSPRIDSVIGLSLPDAQQESAREFNQLADVSRSVSASPASSVAPREIVPAISSSQIPPEIESEDSSYWLRDNRQTLIQMVWLIWLTITLVLLLRVLAVHVRAVWVARSKESEFGAEKGEQHAWIPDFVDVIYCDQQVVPITTGIFRRRIVLPGAAKLWPAEQVRMVLKHELGHVVRRDVLWQLVTSIATSIFWFQPLVWWADRQLKLEREKACDDYVIAGGEHAVDYASLLIQLAAAISKRNTVPTGAISMAQKPIEKRLVSILSPVVSRAPANRWLGRLVTTIALCVVAGVCSIRPFTPLAVAKPMASETRLSTQDFETDSLNFPEQLVGEVVDEFDRPVVGAELRLTATPRPKNEAYHFQYTSDTVQLPIVKTDKNGRYVVPTSDLVGSPCIWSFHGKVIFENRPDAPFSKTVRKGGDSELEVRTIQFQPGKAITGRIVPPSINADAQLENPTITVRPIGIMHSHKWLGETVRCKSDGRFSVVVARDVRVSIQATADNFAGTGVEVQAEKRDLGDIPLQAGSKLKGKLLDRKGNPVAGVFVFSETNRESYHFSNRSVTFEPNFSRYAKTDAKGEFELLPQVGKIRVSLRSEIYDFDACKGVAADRVPPVVIPLQIDLTNSDAIHEIKLKEAKTVQASGTVRWPDGSPVIGIDASLSLMIGSSGIQVYSTTTDQNGAYTVLVPENVQSTIGVLGARNEADQWLTAKASTKSDKAFQQSSQILGLRPLAADAEGLDWKLASTDRSRASSASGDKQELKRLLYGPRSPDEEEIRIRLASELDKDEKQKLSEIYRRQQEQKLAQLVAFERKHRGKFLGAVALASFIDLNDTDQLDEFAANYIDSPNADAVIVDIYYQGNLDHTRKVLQMFHDESPHANIRASALYCEAGLILTAIRYRDYFKESDWRPKWPQPKTKNEELQVANYKQTLDELLACDADQLLVDFNSILQELNTKYAAHGSRIINWAGTRLKERRTEAVNVTYAQQLQQHRFQLENLNAGQPLPNLVGFDVYGARFDSKQLQGKAVLLFFTSNLYTNRSNFKKLAELKQRYTGRPFEIVSVMVDAKREDARKAVDDGKITWKTLYDVDQMQMKQWQFDPCSDRLLIDHKGSIHRRAMYGTDLDETIEQLVRNAEGK